VKAIKKIFIITNVVLFLATILSYFAPYVNPSKAWVFPFFATSYFWLLLGNIIFMLFWALLKSKIWLLSLFAVLCGLQHIGSYLTFSLDRSTSDDISIMTFNTGGGYSLPSGMTGEEYRKQFGAMIKEQNKPDILCLQESAHTKFYLEKLGYKNFQRVSSTIILSDFDIIDKGSIQYEDTSNRVVWADLVVKDINVRVVNMHLQSNMVSSQTKDLVNHPDLRERKTWSDMKSVIGKIKRASKIRTTQALDAKTFINASPYPTLVVGDFNDTPMSYTYRQLAKRYTDAFKKRGNGIGVTYAGSIPGLRIDYILGSKDIQFNSYECLPIEISDHYPIISHFDLNAN